MDQITTQYAGVANIEAVCVTPVRAPEGRDIPADVEKEEQCGVTEQ